MDVEKGLDSGKVKIENNKIIITQLNDINPLESHTFPSFTAVSNYGLNQKFF